MDEKDVTIARIHAAKDVVLSEHCKGSEAYTAACKFLLKQFEGKAAPD